MGDGLCGLVLLDGLRLVENVFRDRDYSGFIDYLDDLFVVLFDDGIRRRNCLILFDYLRGFGIDEISKRYGCSIEEVEYVLYRIERFLDENLFYYYGLSKRFGEEFTDNDILSGSNYTKEESYERNLRYQRSLFYKCDGIFQDGDISYRRLVYRCGDLEFSEFVDDFLLILKRNLKPKHFAIFEMYINGNSIIDIAKFYGVSKQRISVLLREIIDKVRRLMNEYKYYDLYDVYQSDANRCFYSKYDTSFDLWR
jgi:Mor family transcriptional regulator